MESPESDDQVWKILIVDDEPEVHILTRTVLKQVRFEEKPLLFFSAYDAPETKKILEEESDIALILMDVVMEEEDTGLELVRFIREDLGDRLTRIILRTGAPGEAPERKIIVDYEINDYKEKVDLTTPRLFTSVIKSLRNYRDLKNMRQINRELEESRERLTAVIRSSSELSSTRSIEKYLGVLIVQTELMLSGADKIILVDMANERVINGEDENIDFLSEIIPILKTLHPESYTSVIGDYFIGKITASKGESLLLVCGGCADILPDELQMLEIYFGSANSVYSNLTLNENALATQSETIGILGDVIENRSRDLHGHQERVSEYAVILARKLDFSEDDISILKDAVKLHDTGKIGIYDSILDKPGPLTPEQFEIMKSHTTIGYEMLKSSPRKLFQMAAIIALEHHERWDGKGYPRGVSGDKIDMIGRITCIVDVFDALSRDRVYRKAWPFEKTIQFIKDGRGTQFDPKMVDFFLEEQDRIRKIKEQ